MTVDTRHRKSNFPVFCLLWLALLAFYLPAGKAGFVADFTGWLTQLKELSFTQYLNRHGSAITSLYQFTQFVTYLLYKIFGLNPWLWLLLHITLQAVNSFLLYYICLRIFEDAGIAKGRFISLAAMLLFCICPHLTETIVWKSSYHYLQGFLFILLIMYWVQQFLYTQRVRYAWWAALVFLCSTYALEIFYLTPWFVLSLALYYRFALGCDKAVFKKVCLYFVLPQLVLFCVHLLVFRLVFGSWVPHIAATLHQPAAFYLSKPLKYLFHILFFGRFFSSHLREVVYAFSESTVGILLFYAVLLTVCIGIVIRLQKMTARGKIAVLFFCWLLIALSILIPLSFPPLLLVYGDRYTYLLSAFIYLLLCVLFSYITVKYVAMFIWTCYALLNSYFTIRINTYWKHSAYIINRLMQTFPATNGKTVILLDEPDDMNGIPMIHDAADNEFKLQYNLMMPRPLTNKVYDGLAFNMKDLNDGAHVRVLNDSTLRITLNQWGTWWWYNELGAANYENDDYKVNVTDVGHEYELILKKPSSGYILLYQIGGVWKEVDWNNRTTDQY